MKSGFDINRISGDGYLILPLSMSRLAHGHGQDPQQVYEFLKYFPEKFETYSNDVVFLYTYGLYADERSRLNQQAVQHTRELRKLIEKGKRFVPAAFHYLSFDYVVLNSPEFPVYFDLLKKTEQDDEQFRAVLHHDMHGRAYGKETVNFLLEEIAVTHIMRQHLVDLPRTLVRRDLWRLVAYPGPYLQGDRYQWEQKLLPQSDDVNPYAGGQYDVEKKVFCDFGYTANI